MNKDYTGNKAHAYELVERLRDFWRLAGYPNYKFWLETIEIINPDGSKGSKRYEIKSNLVLRVPDH